MATWPATLCESVPGDALGHEVKPNAAHDTVEAAAATAITATGGLHAEQHSSLVWHQRPRNLDSVRHKL